MCFDETEDIAYRLKEVVHSLTTLYEDAVKFDRNTASRATPLRKDIKIAVAELKDISKSILNKRALLVSERKEAKAK